MNRHCCTRIFITIFGLSLASTALSTPTGEPTKASELRQQVLEFVANQLENNADQHRLEIEVAQLDSRLKLSSCSKELEFELHGQQIHQGRILVKTNCRGTSPWSIFVSTYVKRFVPVATSKYPLKRGQIINSADIELKEHDVSKLRDNYYTGRKQLAGLVARRSLPAETVLQSTQLEAANLINRGDEVYISASNGPVSVQMPAVALSKGKLGQQISVRNRSSNKVVRARVTGAGQVEVVM